MMNAIEIKGLSKKFGKFTAVDNLNLSVESGELFALLGVNGAGKTTTIKMLSGLLKATSGDAFLDGKSIVSQSAQVKEIIGVSPQETAVAPKLTVRENIDLMCGIYGLSGSAKKERAEKITEMFGLKDVLSKKAEKLSGGWQRRLSIALAFTGNPKILFLDEPTLGLDVIARSELWDVIRSLKDHSTVILTTHYMEEAQKLSDRIGIMKNGKLLFVGTDKEIMETTGKNEFEEAFIAVVKEKNL